jgi:hypothetical protein
MEGAVVYLRAVKADNSLASEDFAHRVAWRARLLAGKALVQVPDLTWSDLPCMLRRRGGFGLERITGGVIADGSVANPRWFAHWTSLPAPESRNIPRIRCRQTWHGPAAACSPRAAAWASAPPPVLPLQSIHSRTEVRGAPTHHFHD